MAAPPMLPPLAIDAAGWLAPLGVAVLTFTLLRRYRLRTTPRPKRRAAARSDAGSVREAIRESVGAWELRLHDAGRAAEASLNTRAAELGALTENADRAADRLRVVPGDAGCETHPLPEGEERVRRHLRQAGYDDRQIDVLLNRDAPGERRRAA